MDKLKTIYKDWHTAYTTLDLLIKVSRAKIVRDEEKCKSQGLTPLETITYLLQREQEELYDTFAYNDAIALRFHIFSKLSFKLLKSYFQEIHHINTTSKSHVIHLCSQFNLVKTQDFKLLLELNCISDPLEHNQILYLNLTQIISQLILNLQIPNLCTNTIKTQAKKVKIRTLTPTAPAAIAEKQVPKLS
jgi:hypothetical protein